MSQEKVDQYKKNKAVRGKNKRKNKKLWYWKEYYNEENVLFTLNPNIYSETVLEDNLSKVNEHLKSKMN